MRGAPELHVQHTPQAELEDNAFLTDDLSNRRPEFARGLCQIIGKNGSVLT
jgi:hypothetical protein